MSKTPKAAPAPADPELPKLLLVRDVAEILGTTRRRVLALVSSGRLAAVQLGPKTLRVPAERLAEFLRASATAPRVA